MYRVSLFSDEIVEGFYQQFGTREPTVSQRVDYFKLLWNQWEHSVVVQVDKDFDRVTEKAIENFMKKHKLKVFNDYLCRPSMVHTETMGYKSTVTYKFKNPEYILLMRLETGIDFEVSS